MAKKVFVIETPNKHFNGVREGLTFENGKAETGDKKLAERLTNPGDHYGYFCAEIGRPNPAAAGEVDPGDKDPDAGAGIGDSDPKDKDPDAGAAGDADPKEKKK